MNNFRLQLFNKRGNSAPPYAQLAGATKRFVLNYPFAHVTYILHETLLSFLFEMTMQSAYIFFPMQPTFIYNFKTYFLVRKSSSAFKTDNHMLTGRPFDTQLVAASFVRLCRCNFNFHLHTVVIWNRQVC